LTSYDIFYNLCSNLNESTADCNGDYYAAFDSSPSGTADCTAMSSSSTDSITYTSSVSNDNLNQIAIQYNGVDAIDGCDNPTFTVNMICDTSIAEPSTTTTVTKDNCNYSTSIAAADACPVFTVNGLWTFLEQYDWLWGAIFIVMGVFLTFLGRKLFLAAVFIAAFFLTGLLFLALCYGTFLADNTEDWVGWLMLSISIVLGAIVGVLLVKYSKFAAAVIGAWAGYILGLFLNDLALWPIGLSWVFWVVNVACALICAVLAFIFFNPAVILGTAFIGSYALMRGIGMYAGGFQNEYTIAQEIQTGAVDNILWTTYAYLAGVLVSFIIGSIVQFKMFNKLNEEEKMHPYDRLK